MKVVILAGGLGTRITEESQFKPKPMIEIGGKPILWHIMKIYSYYGFTDFIICLGYKGYVIKEFFANYFLHNSDVTIDLKKNKVEVHKNTSEPWKVSLIDTGLNTMTGGRLKRIQSYVGDETFLLTYGDGVCDVDIKQLVNFHKNRGKLATLTGIQPAGRFGILDIKNDDSTITSFQEKPKNENAWINGGFFVLEPQIFDYIKNGDQSVWEKEPMERLALEHQFNVYKHTGFWKCMDTLRDKQDLEDMWENDTAAWKLWQENN